MNPLTVRELIPGDATGYRALMLQGYAGEQDAFTSTVQEREAEPLAWWIARIGGDGQPLQAFGAFAGDALVGAVAMEYAGKARTRHKADLIGMYVDPQHRRAGAGRALVQAALEHARRRGGTRVVNLTVTQGNVQAQQMYEAAGFIVFGVEPMAILAGPVFKAKVHMQCTLAPQPLPLVPSL